MDAKCAGRKAGSVQPGQDAGQQRAARATRGHRATDHRGPSRLCSFTAGMTGKGLRGGPLRSRVLRILLWPRQEMTVHSVRGAHGDAPGKRFWALSLEHHKILSGAVLSRSFRNAPEPSFYVRSGRGRPGGEGPATPPFPQPPTPSMGPSLNRSRLGCLRMLRSRGPPGPGRF